MRSFLDIVEARGDTAVFTFGRFNPPTTGHEKLIDALAKQQSKTFRVERCLHRDDMILAFLFNLCRHA